MCIQNHYALITSNANLQLAAVILILRNIIFLFLRNHISLSCSLACTTPIVTTLSFDHFKCLSEFPSRPTPCFYYMLLMVY